MDSAYCYIFSLFLVVYLLRTLPHLLMRKGIRSPFLRSFLFYLPYVTLALMTFPAILFAAGPLVQGAAAMAAGCILAWRGKGLLPVVLGCCAAVLALELVL